ncbi:MULTISPECIES: hypothetical protein [Burkholderia]|uniref:hypothetical protein n=1 Tax=Burkholderia TaxID=32008 RepID=UPI0011777630|nr:MULTISPECIES: hypothetical protein [Burkholderia]MBY4727547.1 hypothetical protein [Burkholderia contaminans]MCI3974762.1 hypothetical protein [Burkholderia sp. HI4860]MDN7789693.1 hypothetical protein [Burkholderia contaminans]
MRAIVRASCLPAPAIDVAHSVLRQARKTANDACGAREYAATALFDGDSMILIGRSPIVVAGMLEKIR